MVCAAIGARTDLAEILKAVNAGGVAVAESELDGVVSYGLGLHRSHPFLVHRQQGFVGGLGFVFPAGGAGTFLSQVVEGVFAVMPVLPVDADAFARGQQHLDAGRFCTSHHTCLILVAHASVFSPLISLKIKV